MQPIRILSYLADVCWVELSSMFGDLAIVMFWFRLLGVDFTHIVSDYFTGASGKHIIDQFHKSQNAPVPYPTMLYSEQKCAHFCSEWSIVGYGTHASGDLWIRSIATVPVRQHQRIYGKRNDESTMQNYVAQKIKQIDLSI